MSAPKQLPSIGSIQHAHFLGIGGVGVSGIARIFAQRGITVTGTDAKDLPVMHELEDLGAKTYVGYDAAHIAAAEEDTGKPIDVVIASSVATATNPERVAAKERSIPVLHRSEGLVLAMEGHKVLTFAGTHGKTTTSSMAATTFASAGFDPSFAVGSAVANLGVNASLGAGEWFIAEADESDGTLLNYRPDIAVVTNIEADHLDFYGTEEAVHQVFFDHATTINPGGVLIVCAADEGAAGLGDRIDSAPELDVSVLRYGVASESAEATTGLDLAIVTSRPDTDGTGQEVDFQWADGAHSTVHLALPGMHNALNAAAVMLASQQAGMSPEASAEGLAQFTGTARRFQFHGAVANVRVFDDYAHHPTEVAAAIRAAKSLAEPAAVHAVFQPHLFSRTQNFSAEFAEALSLADRVRVLEIYPAREEPIPGVTAELVTNQLCSVLRDNDPACATAVSAEQAVNDTVANVEPGDIVITLGAGDVTQLAPKLVEQLKERFNATA